MGYIDFEKYIKLPAQLIEYIISIKAATTLRSTKLELQNTKDREIRKKLQNNIKDMEDFFNER